MKTIALFAAFVIATSIHTPAAACYPAHPQPMSDSLLIKPYFVGKKHIVRLYPDPASGSSVNIDSNIEGELHFYIFDVNGVMLYRSTLKGHEEKNIPDLRKGIYTYDVFRDDESIEQGSIIVK